MSERQVEEVDCCTFMTMTEEKNIGRVDIESNQIIFTDKEEKQVYKTGKPDERPGATQRLGDAGAQFSSVEIRGAGSPMLNFLDLVPAAHPVVQLHRQPDEQKLDGKRPAAAWGP